MKTYAELRMTYGVPDGDAVESFRGLETADFESLYQDQWSAVVNYVRFRIGTDEAQDIAAEVFARAWSRRSSFDPRRGSPVQWLWGVARHATVDWSRRARVARAGARPEAPDHDPAQSVLEDESTRELLEAVRTLSADDRELVALRFGLGLSNRESAQALGLTEGNAAVRLHRALGRLRRRLAG